MREAGALYAGATGFFTRRWRRQVPLGLLFWRDMVAIGSLVNLTAVFGGLLALGFKADLAAALVIIHAPLPYNIFLAGSVWRTAEQADNSRAASARLGAVLWFLAAILM